MLIERNQSGCALHAYTAGVRIIGNPTMTIYLQLEANFVAVLLGEP